MRGILAVVVVMMACGGEVKKGTHARTELRDAAAARACAVSLECGAGERCVSYSLTAGDASFCAPRDNPCALVHCPESGSVCVEVPDWAQFACVDTVVLHGT